VRVTLNLTALAILMMLLLGSISLVASVNYDSSVLAFIGLGLVFWAAILFYIKPEEYTRKTMLGTALSPSLTALNQIITKLGYTGDVTYLPPKYFTNPETTKICISKYKYASLPTPIQTQRYEDQPVARTIQGLLLFTPTGIQLSKLLEKSLGKSFIRTDLKDLHEHLPEIFIEKLEIAENLELKTENEAIQTEGGSLPPFMHVQNVKIHARITKPFYGTPLKRDEETSRAGLIGDPIFSAIAIAITKATGKPVRIADIMGYEGSNTTEATYEIIEEQ
jgi:hypothetical protein